MSEPHLTMEYTRRGAMVVVHNSHGIHLRPPGTREAEQHFTTEAFELLRRANRDVTFVERVPRNA
jgi:hypothetical protein